MCTIGADVGGGRSGHEGDEDCVDYEQYEEDTGDGDGVIDCGNDGIVGGGDGGCSHGSDDDDVEEEQLEGGLQLGDSCCEGDAVLVCVEDGEDEGQGSRWRFDEGGDWKTHDVQSKCTIESEIMWRRATR